ncbi:glycosyltransferase family 2 protein [Vibrio genomosp. F10 str. 9ZC157]|uniref:Dolichol monophosphate mannose synthase n=1 Tax=Vibrio genomosp. F10 str. ZF-129 TaxID=1187848 RepID=A0A1E5BDC7_9VIBR|nr:glycosyltransferase family 2 protein [Vibrio genomosp. F10]OEE33115.1 dolichol monophosphate mannose synthase [Vibrio genomosp. F10 str. ZF-129]OEE95616.1 dolichol monophosphate mannose synthase [Vibrio genomosp. F10 str. 9ZC157]
MRKITIVTPCFNEELNVEVLYEQVKEQFEGLDNYTYEHIFIDNASTDKTVEILKKIAALDNNVKIIVNSRNFGHIRSPQHGLLQGTGDATLFMVADLQDPPELIPEFIEKWEAGNDLVLGVKNESKESPLMFLVRKSYYNLVSKISETQLQKNFYGFGLYDKKIIDILKAIPDPYPYLRGLLMQVGFEVERVYYTQPVRKRGITKNNFFSLYDMAMLGICSHSKVPLRIATISGFILSFLTFCVAMLFLVLKLVFWDAFPMGTAPIIIGMFFLGSVQIFFIGVVGEYVGHLVTKSSNFPLVIEKERINF